MATWSIDLLADFRADSGDNDTSPKVADAKIQEWYESAVLTADDDDQAYALVMVKILRRLLGDARKKIDTGNPGTIENEKSSQIFDHLFNDLIPYWEELAGLNSDGFITTGEMSLGIDYTQEDYEAGV